MPFSQINFFKNYKGHTDDLSIVKAAAWAWYQHGSGSDGKPIREFDYTNTHRNPIPSRYKLEAMKRKTARDDSLLSSCSDSNTSLLHTYERDVVAKEAGNFLESRDAKYGGVFEDDQSYGRRVAALSESETADEKVGRVKGDRKSRVFLWRHACGTRDDVVVNNISLRSRRSTAAAGKVIAGG